MFSFGFCEIIKNSFFIAQLQVAPSELGSVFNNVKVLKLHKNFMCQWAILQNKKE